MRGWCVGVERLYHLCITKKNHSSTVRTSEGSTSEVVQVTLKESIHAGLAYESTRGVKISVVVSASMDHRRAVLWRAGHDQVVNGRQALSARLAISQRSHRLLGGAKHRSAEW